jgi:hypothetical protein
MNTRHTHVSAISAAFAAIVLAGCGTTAATTADGTPASTTPSHSASVAADTGSGSVASGASVPFPIAIGNTWVYKETGGSSSEIGTTINKVVSVVQVAGGQQVTMTTSGEVGGTPSPALREIYTFHSDGSITYPLTQAGPRR